MIRSVSPKPASAPIVVALSLALAVAALIGCADKTEPSIINPDITGVVTSVLSSRGRIGFRVVWTEAMGQRSDFRFDAVQVSATRQLEVEDGTGSSSPPLSAADLKVGDIVAVYLEGQVTTSNPPQGTAKWVTYLGTHKGELPKVPGLDPLESTATP